MHHETRSFGRTNHEMRPVRFLDPIQKAVAGSVIVEVGNTVVNCSVSMEENVPPFLNPEESGWLTGEYAMLPAASSRRTPREASRGKQSGRTVEIQRLIGRTFRSVVDLKRFPGKTIWIDCDVLQADGGTRTAAITGACVAFQAAVPRWKEAGLILEDPMIERVAAVSLGIVDGAILLDLDYPEDSRADVDMNLVMTRKGNLVEVQISSEKNVFSREQMNALLDLGRRGIEQLAVLQENYLAKA